MIHATDITITQQFISLGQTLPLPITTFFATFLIWIISVVVLLVSRRSTTHQLNLFIQAVSASVAAYTVNAGIGLLFFRSRPFVVFDFEPMVHLAAGLKSFPSDHTTLSWALAITVWHHDRKWGSVLAVAGLLVGMGRMLAGVHYATDVLGGIVVGTVIATMVHVLWKRFKLTDRF